MFLVILIFLINESQSSMELSCHGQDFFQPASIPARVAGLRDAPFQFFFEE